MSFPEENVRNKNSGKVSNLIVFILLLIVIVGISFLVYLKSQNFDFKAAGIQEIINNSFRIKTQNVQKPKATVIQCDEKEKYAFAAYKDMLIKCTSDNVKAINKEGIDQWSIPVAMSNPKIKKSSSDLLVYDLGGKDIVVISGKTVKWNKKLDNNIINADISDGGYVSVVQELKGYKAAVTVFNLQGNEFFTRSYADNFVYRAMVSPAGEYVVIASLDISGVQATTNIEFTDMLGKPFSSKVPAAGEIFPGLWFMRDEILAFVNENSVVCIDKASKDQKEKWKQNHKDGVIYSSAAAGKYLFVAMSGDSKSASVNSADTEVKIFSTEGKQVAKYSLHDRILNMDTYSDLAALNTGREILFINTQGKLVGKYSSKVDLNEVHFFNKQEIAAVSKSNVTIAKIEQ